MNGLGASLHDNSVTFRVWAPRCQSVELVIEGRPTQALWQGDEGMYTLTVPRLAAGTRYQYRLDSERYRPDPVSRWQPEGVHGPSAVVDPNAFTWTDAEFRGHALADLVFYELHVGTFTAPGTFEAIIPYLDMLNELGVTAIEIMPVAEFPGSRNWGYDGVHLFAPQSTYGGPRGLRRLVDACHSRGLSVVLDVVYNHLGPEGNYLAEFGPYFTDRYKTPWGQALNFDGPDGAPVRRHFVENARYWVREFHIDGLRLDAIHSIFDASPVHILTEIAEAARAEGARLGRPVHIIAESHDNDRNIVLPPAQGGLGLDAVWSDDFHHAVHVQLTGERGGYYADFGDPHLLARALAEGFAFQGEFSEYFGRPRGTPSKDLAGEHFVIAIQNHDQVGNRAQGDRLGAIVPFEALKLAAGLMFAAPELAAAVRRGRTAEFSRFAWQGSVPDPGDPATFVRSRLNPSLATAPRHRALREYYRTWLALRRSHPALGATNKELARAGLDEGNSVLSLARWTPSGETVHLVANLTAERRPWVPSAGWRLRLDSADPRFGGTALLGRLVTHLEPFQLLLYESAR
jgi:maltooligosyltrehalose trehalohydrolase